MLRTEFLYRRVICPVRLQSFFRRCLNTGTGVGCQCLRICNILCTTDCYIFFSFFVCSHKFLAKHAALIFYRKCDSTFFKVSGSHRFSGKFCIFFHIGIYRKQVKFFSHSFLYSGNFCFYRYLASN